MAVLIEFKELFILGGNITGCTLLNYNYIGLNTPKSYFVPSAMQMFPIIIFLNNQFCQTYNYLIVVI